MTATEGRAPQGTMSLTALEPGEGARIWGLRNGLQGLARRRLLDLGFTPGARITCELASLFGDPRAYRIRGALIALREAEAIHVLVEAESQGGGDDTER